MDLPAKDCTRCGARKPLTDFYDRRMPNGTYKHYSECKECHKRRMNTYHRALVARGVKRV